MGSSGPPPGYPTVGNQQNYPSAGVKPADDPKAGGYGQQTGTLNIHPTNYANELERSWLGLSCYERSRVLGFTTVLTLSEALEAIMIACLQ